MKVIKYLLYLIVTLLVLIAVAITAIVFFVNPNDYKTQIENLARSQANIALTIEGDIGLKFFPWIGLSVDKVRVASVEMPDKPLASVERFDAYLRLMPLLHKQVEVSDINVHGLNAHLFKNAQGQVNWAGVGKTAQTAAPKAAVHTQETAAQLGSPTQAEGNKVIEALKINSININDGAVVYEDLSTKQRMHISQLMLKTGVVALGAPIDFNIRATLANQSPKLSLTLSTQARLIYDVTAELYQLSNIALSSTVDASSVLRGSKPIAFKAGGALKVDLKSGMAQWISPDFTLNQLMIKGDVVAKDINKNTPVMAMKLQTNTLNLKEFLKDLGIVLPSMSGANALSVFAFSANIQASAKMLSLTNIVATLDETKVSGSIKLPDLSKQTIEGVLQGNRLNVDHYLPAKTAAVKPAAPSNAKGNVPNKTAKAPVAQGLWSTTPLLSSEQLRGINAKVTLSFNEVVLNALPFKQFAVNATINSGLVTVNKMGANLFSGALALQGSINGQKTVPVVRIKPTLTNLPLKEIITTLKLDVPLEGTLNLSGDMTTQGRSAAELIRALGGNALFKVNNGLLRGISYEYELCRGFALLNREQLTSAFNKDSTQFEQLSASLNIVKGIVHNGDLVIALPGVVTKGSGTFDLNTLNLNYALGLNVTGDRRIHPDPACRVNPRIANIALPLKCQGSISNPKKLCALDEAGLGLIVRQLGEAKLKKEVDQQLDKQLEKLDKKLEKKLGDKAPEVKQLLKGLLGK